MRRAGRRAVRDRASRALDGATLAALAGYAAAGAFLAVRGLVNGDEGWYLYAARLAMRGELPYVDFAYTQMPLHAYVYGVPQVLGGGLLAGRLTSVALAVGAVALSAWTARRLAGPAAGAFVAGLALGYPAGIYFAALVKTYALAAFLLAATFAALAAKDARERSDPIAVAAAIALALTRTSGLPFAALVTLWCVATAPSARARRRSLAVAAAGMAIGAGFLLPDLAAVRFFLGDFHQIWWYGAPTATKIAVILTERIPAWGLDYAPYWALLAAACVASLASAEGRTFARENPALPLTFLGLGGFLATHLVAGQFGSVEYFVPAIPVTLGMCAAVGGHLLLGPAAALPPRRAAALATAVGVAVCVVTLWRPSVAPFVERPGGDGTIAAIDEVAQFVRASTGPGDEILAFWAQHVAVEADRDLVPGISLGIFSYVDRPKPEAEALHSLNRGHLLALLRTRRPAAVVLSDVDLAQLRKAGTLSKRKLDPAPLLRLLEANYRLSFTGRGHGLVAPERVYVYLRR